jgi:hypothetical protein
MDEVIERIDSLQTGEERVHRRENAIADPQNQIVHERGKVRVLPTEESKYDVRLKHRENPARPTNRVICLE